MKKIYFANLKTCGKVKTYIYLLINKIFKNILKYLIIFDFKFNIM